MWDVRSCLGCLALFFPVRQKTGISFQFWFTSQKKVEVVGEQDQGQGHLFTSGFGDSELSKFNATKTGRKRKPQYFTVHRKGGR